MSLCSQRQCQCFASGCAYVGDDSSVYGCPSSCCNGKCAGQISSGKNITTISNPDSNKYILALGALLIFLAIISTISLT